MTGKRSSAFDAALYAMLVEAADSGHPCPKADDLVERLGCESNSTPAECLARLEAAGLVAVKRYQQHRVVTIIASGRSTAEPANPKPHWRDRPLGMAQGALRLADMAEPGVSDAIRSLSASRGLPVPDLILEIMRRGWEAVRSEDGALAA